MVGIGALGGRAAGGTWPPLRAVTLDLWGTLIESRDPEGKIERRREMLLAAIRGAGHDCSLERLRAGFRAARVVIDRAIAREAHDVGPAGRWEELMRQLDFPPESVPFAAVEAAYEDLALEFLPPLMPGAAEAVDGLAGRYRLGLICNTGYTGGRVLRQVLERHGLARYFAVLTFSNELGWLKPDPRIFHHTLDRLGARPGEALHVGDTEEADIRGARAAGLYAARYVPAAAYSAVTVTSETDVVFSDWAELPDLIASKQTPA